MGNGHFSALLPTSLTFIFLPVTEASSVIIKLDLVSKNSSTLQKQKSVIREMWPLAHIASVVAYIFALYPQDSDPTEAPTTSFWQEVPLLALQRIQQGKPSKDIAKPQPMQPEEVITAEVVDRFCSSLEDILQLLAAIAEQPPDLFGLTPSLRGSFPDVFCMALDTCARGLKSIHRKFHPSDPSMLQLYESRLHMLTRRLYDMSQNDFLSQGNSIRYVRRSFKVCVRLSGPGSSSSSSPDRNQMGSIPDSPQRTPDGLATSDPEHVSAIPRIAIDSSSPYGCAGDASTMASSMPSSSSRSSSGTSTTNSFTPFDELGKPDWQPIDMMFNDVLDHNALGAPTGGHHISIVELVDLQNACCPQMPTMMDFDMTGHIPVQCGQWD
ncbi:Zn(2)-C6 fungal-type DNA-binding domain protein [Ilyonectria robusta]